ncbi:MAG: ABC transporter ATP-binding protein [Gammaproteobacteria bacterium]
MTDALTISDLTKTYANGVQALKGVELRVREGDFFALLGPNGAGKSTTIGIISSLIRKTAGSVKVFDYDIDTDIEAAKSCIGLVPQEFNFNQFEPVIEIVANQAGYYGIGRNTAYQRAEKYLKQLGLWGKRRGMARELSGGMKRRLMIARALVHEPRMLILDEPTAGVDIEIRRSMWSFLREVNRAGTTIILTTHYLELMRLNVETFVLNLNKAITELPPSPGYQLSLIDETTLEVTISKEQSMNDLFRCLSDYGIDVISMRNKTNRLEELFVRLVEQGAL